MDWTRIDSPERFHDLVNDVCSSELGPAYVPGRPRGGKDRGFDGRYEGQLDRLAPDIPRGKVMVQAKHVTQSPADAFTALRMWLRDGTTRGGRRERSEIEKAEAEDVDVLYVVTDANLQPAQVAELEGLATGTTLKRIVVHARERLEMTIRRHLGVCRRFFGGPVRPALRPVEDFEPYGDILLAALPYTGRTADMERLREEVEHLGSPVLVLFGPGGIGKTRFLMEAARRGSSFTQRHVRILVPDIRPLTNVVQDEILDDRDYLIIVDDADRLLHDLLPLVRLAIETHGRVALLLCARIGSHAVLLDLLHRNALTRPTMLELKALQAKDVEKLMDDTELTRQQRQAIIVQTRGNIFLVSYVLQALRDGRHPFDDAQGLFAFVAGRLAEQADAALSLQGYPTSRDFLPVLAALVPFRHHDHGHLSVLADLAGLDPEQAGSFIDCLIRAHVLRLVGHAVRFAADMLGDIVLSNRANDPSGTALLERIVCQGVLDVFGDSVLSNLASVAISGSTSLSALQSLVRSWTESLSTVEDRAIVDRVLALKRLAHVVPEESLDLLDVAAAVLADRHSQPGDVPPIPLGARWLPPGHLSLDVAGPVLLLAGRTQGYTSRSISLLMKLEGRVRPGAFSNYAPKEIAGELCNAFRVPADGVRDALRAIERELGSQVPGEYVRKSFEGAIKMVLADTVRREYSEGAVIHVDSQAYPDVPVVRELRARALELALRALGHASSLVRTTAIQCLRAIGEDRGIPVGSLSSSLGELLAQERVHAVEALAARLTCEPEFQVRQGLEAELIFVWASRETLPQTAEKALLGAPRELPYRVFLRSVSCRHSIPDNFAAFASRAPVENRWEWYVGTMYTDTDCWSEDCARVAAEVGAAYKTPESLVGLLREVAVPGADHRMATDWLRQYARCQPSVLETLVMDEAWFSAVPSVLRFAVDASYLAEVHGTAERFVAAIASRAGHPEGLTRLRTVLAVRTAQVPASVRHQVLTILMNSEDEHVRAQAARDARMENLVPGARAQLYALALRRAFTPEVVYEVAAEIQHPHHGSFGDSERRVLDVTIRTAVVRGDDITFDGACTVVRWILDNDLIALADVFEQRLCHQAASRDARAPSVFPHDLSGWFAGVGPATMLALRTRFLAWHEAGLVQAHHLRALMSALGKMCDAATRSVLLNDLVSLPPSEDLVLVAVCMLAEWEFERFFDEWGRLALWTAKTPYFADVLNQIRSQAAHVGSWQRTPGQRSAKHAARTAFIEGLLSGRALDVRMRLALQDALRDLKREEDRLMAEDAEEFGIEPRE